MPVGALSCLGYFSFAVAVSIYALHRQPRFLLRWIQRRHGVVYFVPTEQPRVALTIDDSPSEATSAILDVLAQYNTKATFFILGKATVDDVDLVRRIVEDGHEIGNHLLEDRPAFFMTRDEFCFLLDKTQRALGGFAEVRWFRPPAAFYRTWMVAAAHARGLTTALGSVHPYDATIASPGYSKWQIIRNARPGDIIVLHDGKGRGARTQNVLEWVLPRLKDRGMHLGTLTELANSPNRRND